MTKADRMVSQTLELGRKRRIVFSLVTFLIPVVAAAGIYVAYAGYRTKGLYWYTKSNQRGWTGKVYKADAQLGFATIPYSRGAEVFPVGDDVPARFDKDGFRVPVADKKGPSTNRNAILLTIGDSFTYGAAVAAEDTYSFLVGQDLGLTSKNAGVPSYGLAQMLIVAQRLIPAHKPEYVIAQYSDWLVGRAQSAFGQTYFGKLPVPYFFVKHEGLAQYPPVFGTKIFDLPVDRYRATRRSVIDKASFLWNVGIPLFAHDDFHMSSYYVKKTLGLVPEPAANGEELTKYVYQAIARVAKENGAKLVIVILGNDYEPVHVPEGAFPADAIIVKAHDALIEHLLPIPDKETYEKTYFHWRGSPLQMVDPHPNERAHRIISNAIVQKIQGEAAMQPDKRMLDPARQ